MKVWVAVLLVAAILSAIYFMNAQGSNCWVDKARGYPFVTNNPKYFPLPPGQPMPPGVGGYGPIQPPQGPSHIIPFPTGVAL